LTLIVYEISDRFPKVEDDGLTSQARKAAISIPSNIAEGCGRGTYKGVLNFLFNAGAHRLKLKHN